MIQVTNTEHELQIRERRNRVWCTWRPALVKQYAQAQRLAQQGRIIESLHAAETAHIEQYGDMLNVQFRVQTETRTATAIACLGEGWHE